MLCNNVDERYRRINIVPRQRITFRQFSLASSSQINLSHELRFSTILAFLKILCHIFFAFKKFFITISTILHLQVVCYENGMGTQALEAPQTSRRWRVGRGVLLPTGRGSASPQKISEFSVSKRCVPAHSGRTSIVTFMSAMEVGSELVLCLRGQSAEVKWSE